jgi:WD40 repeat protein
VLPGFDGQIEHRRYQLTEIPGTDLAVAALNQYQTISLIAPLSPSSDPRHKVEQFWLVGARGIAIGPDGRQMAVLADEGELRLHHFPAGDVVAHVPGTFLATITWSHDGRLLAGATQDGIIELRTIPTLERTHQWVGDSQPIHAIAFSMDDQTLAGVSAAGLRLWNVATGTELLTLEAAGVDLERVEFSPDGTMLGAAGRSRNRHQLCELLLWHAPRHEAVPP